VTGAEASISRRKWVHSACGWEYLLYQAYRAAHVRLAGAVPLVNKLLTNLDYSRTDMQGAAGEAVDIYREPVATKQIGSPLG